MTKQEQIEEMAKIVDEMYNVYTTTADDIADGLYNAGYRKVDEIKRLEKENEQLKAKLEKIHDALMWESNDELTDHVKKWTYIFVDYVLECLQKNEECKND